jgi:hydrogenase maturation protease
MSQYTITQYLHSIQEINPMGDKPLPEIDRLPASGPAGSLANSSKLIVLGLGNPLLGDDGVGWVVVQELQNRLASLEIETDLLAGGGLSLMERLVGYTAAIIVDSIYTGCAPRGTVTTFPLEALENPFAGHTGSAHETNLLIALEMGRKLGVQLPEQVMIVAIESPDIYDFDDALSPAVAAAVPEACEAVLRLLDLQLN